MKISVYKTLLICMLIACLCSAAPEPVIVQNPEEWTVDVEFEHLKQIVLRPNAGTRPRRYWYTILTLTNRANQDVYFYPKCDLMTDTFQILPAGKNVSPSVCERIKRSHKNKYPFLESLENTSSKILQGEDNTKDIAIIWPDFDAEADSIKLFITGLSNETVVLDHPIAKNESGEPIKIYLRKTLELSYDLKGDPTLRSNADIVYKNKRWIMR